MGFAVASPLLAQSTWQAAATARHAAPVALDLSIAFYELQLSAETIVREQLASEVTPLSAFTLFSAGLLTSMTPCALAAVPLTLGYLGGLRTDAATETSSGSEPSSDSMQSNEGKRNQLGTLLPALAYSSGFAIVLAGLGVTVASVGGVFGQAGVPGLPLLVAVLTLSMGLNLLDVLPVSLPSISLSTQLPGGLPPLVQAFLFGSVSALISSPCADPVLVALLGFVSQLNDPVLGATLLLFFTRGYTAPVLAAGVLATSARQLADLTERFLWVTPSSGSLLIAYGTYTGCCYAFGQP